MFRITVEEFPKGNVRQGVTVGVAYICNERHHPAGSDVGDFHGYFETPDKVGAGANGYVKDHLRGGNPWRLVAALLKAANV